MIEVSVEPYRPSNTIRSLGLNPKSELNMLALSTEEIEFRRCWNYLIESLDSSPTQLIEAVAQMTESGVALMLDGEVSKDLRWFDLKNEEVRLLKVAAWRETARALRSEDTCRELLTYGVKDVKNFIGFINKTKPRTVNVMPERVYQSFDRLVT